MDRRRTTTALVIHGYAVAHGVAAALLAQTSVGDEVVLTALTIAMILTVANVNGAQWTKGMAASFLAVFAGGYIGVLGAAMLVKWIPFIGNGANAVTTIVTTEVLGWATYIFLSNGYKNPKTITKEYRDEILRRAKEMQRDNTEEGKKYYEAMSKEEQDVCKRILKQLQNKDIPDSTRDLLIKRYSEIIENAARSNENSKESSNNDG